MELQEIFEYKRPADKDQESLKLLHLEALDFARAIRDLTPPGENQRAAVRHVYEALLLACAAVPRG